MHRLRLLACGLTALLAPLQPAAAVDATSLRGALLAVRSVTEARLDQLAAAGTTAIVVVVDNHEGNLDATRQAAALVRSSGLDLYYWIEVGRCPELAARQPRWMASQQTHPEWRRLFPQAPQPRADQVVKTYPWVPILSKETFAAQLDRVNRLLASMPAPDGLFLNDLQGAPSACGCGNSLCRWTSDYGQRRTTIPLPENAAAMFVDQVAAAIPGATVIPVWTTECEQHDGEPEGLCAGVGCFGGICWKAWSAQLAPLEQTCKQVGLLVPYKAFQRDLSVYAGPAGWIAHAVAAMDSMPKKYDRPPLAAARIITILQGWDVSDNEIQTQIQVAQRAGVAGYLVAYWKIDQSWEPRLQAWP